MTDRQLTSALAGAVATELTVRAQWETACRDLDHAERDSALGALREAIALKRSLERWISARSSRAVAQQ
jgi:hypothetical protein